MHSPALLFLQLSRLENVYYMQNAWSKTTHVIIKYIPSQHMTLERRCMDVVIMSKRLSDVVTSFWPRLLLTLDFLCFFTSRIKRMTNKSNRTAKPIPKPSWLDLLRKKVDPPKKKKKKKNITTKMEWWNCGLDVILKNLPQFKLGLHCYFDSSTVKNG